MKSELQLSIFIKSIFLALLVASSLTQDVKISKSTIIGNLNSSPINLANKAQTLNANIASLDANILKNNVVKTPLVPSKQIHQYKGLISIDVNQNEPQTIGFYASFVEDPTNCKFKKCYMGWISKYKVNKNETVQGYPNAQGLQPIFQFDANDQNDIVITFDQNLDETWQQLIEIACEKFNPLFDSPKKRYNIAPAQKKASAISSIAAPKAQIAPSSIDPEIKYFAINTKTAGRTENIKISGLNTEKSKLTEKLQIDAEDDFIASRSQSFQLDLKSETEPDEQDDPLPDLNGIIKIDFTLIGKRKDSGDTEKLKRQFNQPKSKNLLYSRATIESTRASGAKNSKLDADSDFKQRDDEPIIQLIQNKLVPGQKIDDQNFQNQKNKANGVLKKQIQSKIASEGINRILAQQELLAIKGVSESLTTNGVFAATKVPPNVLIGTYTVLDYLKTLYSRNILGRTIKLQVKVKCQIEAWTYFTNAKCTGNLIYQIFGNTKSLNIFSFVKQVNSIWSWSKTFCGNWSFQIRVPLPPPVSLISINFNIGIKYCFTVSLYSSRVSISPLSYKLGSLIETGIETDSRASLRVWPVQGGVYLKGTLVKVGTDPSLTFTFLFAHKKLQILISWYFWISAFQLEWGFFWRYWKLFKGWSPIKVISKWTINGVYQKYTIFYKTITRNL